MSYEEKKTLNYSYFNETQASSNQKVAGMHVTYWVHHISTVCL
jgi:hypothetical protein